MNRKPQPADSWWSAHAATCNGQFIKVSGDSVEKQRSEGGDKKYNKKRTREDSQTEQKETTKKPFFPAPKIYTCVNCESFRTPNLDEIHLHLDNCLTVIDKTDCKKEDEKCKVIDLTKE